MKLRLITWGGMIALGILLKLDVFNLWLEVAAVMVQAILIIACTYLLFKSDKPRCFESDDILDC